VEPDPCLKNGFYRQPTPLGTIEVTVKNGEVSEWSYPRWLKRIRLSPDPTFLMLKEIARRQKH